MKIDEIKQKFDPFNFVLSQILGGNEWKKTQLDTNRDVRITGGQITEVGLHWPFDK